MLRSANSLDDEPLEGRMEAFKNRLKRQRNDFTLNLYQWDDGNLMEEVILILLNIMSNASMGRFQLELNWNYHFHLRFIQ